MQIASSKQRKQKTAVDVDEALRLQEIRCLVFPHSITEQLARASLLMKKELYSQALHDFQSVLLKRPNCIEALLGLGTVEEKNGRFDQAIEHFTRVLTLDSKNAKALYARGECFAHPIYSKSNLFICCCCDGLLLPLVVPSHDMS